MSRRRGSDQAAVLFVCDDPSRWASALTLYSKAVSLKAEVAPATTTKGLISLDKWWREVLPTIVSTSGHLTVAELVQAVDWKLKRGELASCLFACV